MHDTIIFDFDGTLIDSAPGILATYAAVLDAAGIKPAVPLDARLIGPPLQPTMSKLVGPIEAEKLELLVEDFKRLYSDIGVAHTPAYPAAADALRQLRANGKTLYLATNKRAQPTLALLEKFGWAPYFHRVYCIDSYQPAFVDKTAMLQQLLRENELTPERCLYVGDTRGDYISANACRIKFAAALWGYENWDVYLAENSSMLEYAIKSLPDMTRYT
ncbi:MAG TPA: HAD family hydrolase [Rhodocyclaceae bacterium]|nr:HAD family hydrolase [Rhodocyclaceae bacterium]